MSPSFIGSSGKHNGDALLYQTDGHRGVGGRQYRFLKADEKELEASDLRDISRMRA
jgi:hypothetical protein